MAAATIVVALGACSRGRGESTPSRLARRILPPEARGSRRDRAVPEASRAGNDAFPAERQAQELDARLRELWAALREGPARAASVAQACSIRGFAAAASAPVGEAPAQRSSALDVRRETPVPSAVDRRGAFGAELQRLIGDLREITVAEFLITAIEPGDESGRPHHRPLRHRRRRKERVPCRARRRVGMSWRAHASGWQVVRWTATRSS